MSPLPLGILASSGGSGFVATGGTIQDSNGSRHHIFYTSGTFSVTAGELPLNTLMVTNLGPGTSGTAGSASEQGGYYRMIAYSGVGGAGGSLVVSRATTAITPGASSNITIGALGGSNSVSSLSLTTIASAAGRTGGSASQVRINGDQSGLVEVPPGDAQFGAYLGVDAVNTYGLYGGTLGNYGGPSSSGGYAVVVDWYGTAWYGGFNQGNAVGWNNSTSGVPGFSDGYGAFGGTDASGPGAGGGAGAGFSNGSWGWRASTSGGLGTTGAVIISYPLEYV